MMSIGSEGGRPIDFRYLVEPLGGTGSLWDYQTLLRSLIGNREDAGCGSSLIFGTPCTFQAAMNQQGV